MTKRYKNVIEHMDVLVCGWCSVMSDSWQLHGHIRFPSPWIFWAKILEWVAISLFRGSLWPRDQTHFSPALAYAFFTTAPLGFPGWVVVIKVRKLVKVIAYYNFSSKDSGQEKEIPVVLHTKENFFSDCCVNNCIESCHL